MKKILVIAGGDWQIDLVKKAKQMGHYVICSNLYENSPAFPFADACEIANVLDKEENLKIAKKHRPDAIISDQSDISVSTVAYLNERLGLNGIGYDMSKLFSNKYLLRNFCKEKKIPIPEYKKCYSSEDAYALLKKFGKIIIKPLDSQSSRGVFTINSIDELETHYQESISYSSTENAFLAEQYLGGDEFTVDGLVVNSKHYPLCISIKEMYEENSNVSKKQTYTTYHPKYDYDLLRAVNRQLIMSTGLKFGLTHSEYKFFNRKFYLIEAGARGGGSNLSSKIVPFMSGIDNYRYLIKSALGEDVDANELINLKLPQNKCVIMQFFDFGEGVVKKVSGVERLKGSQYLLDYQLNVSQGSILEIPRYGRLRPGHFIIGSDNYVELSKEANEILKAVKIYFK